MEVLVNDSERVLKDLGRIQYRINSNDKKPRSFGTEHLLYQSEIHLIEAIGQEDGINVSNLSKKLGISRKSLWEKRKKLGIEKKK
jgi:DNA-binding NtrC family response regulator